jgi:hypothetical protein
VILVVFVIFLVIFGFHASMLQLMDTRDEARSYSLLPAPESLAFTSADSLEDIPHARFILDFDKWVS